MALRRVSIPSPNYSSRGGSAVRLIVLHTAEGATTYQSLGSYFANPSVQASSHTGIDDTPGVVGEYVPRSGKAWTQANANPYCVSTELCAFAKWTAADWSKHPTMLQNAAAWVAEEAAHFGIPIVGLSAAQAQDGRSKGVCQHVDLGAAGGGHWDCGPNFPIDQVIQMAKGSTPPTPTPPPEDDLTDEQAKQLAAVFNWCSGTGNDIRIDQRDKQTPALNQLVAFDGGQGQAVYDWCAGTGNGIAATVNDILARLDALESQPPK